MKKLLTISFIAALFLAAMPFRAGAQEPDPKFFIYLCIGQSNMEAGAVPDEQDMGPVDPRFQFMAAADMPRYGREVGNWYVAEPPINRQENKLGPVDWFGRTMVKNLPEDYRVGVINVSVAGAKIELWQEDGCDEYLAGAEKWMQDMCKAYDGNPYRRLVEVAKIAQKSGVIKGMLIHQGESNNGDWMWPRKVGGIYNGLCEELSLNSEDFFLLAGELKYKNENGVCSAFNHEVLPNLKRAVPNSYIISAEGCEGSRDPWHFTTNGMRELGKRYAIKALEIQDFPYTGEPASNDPRHAEYALNLKPSELGIEIAPTFTGIFYEDINQSNDGGISAQLIQNNSFQAYDVPFSGEIEFSKDPAVIQGWTVIRGEGAEGTALTSEEKPLVPDLKPLYDFDPDDEYDDNLKYRQFCVKFDIKNAGEGFGIAANGFGIVPYTNQRGATYSVDTQVASIPVKAGVSYDLGLYLQRDSYKGAIQVYLETADGKLNSNIYTIKKLKKEWVKYETQLKAISTEDSRLVIKADKAGVFYLDFVTLVPEASELWMDGKYGDFRKDMLEALAALNPKFMRFPGGCASEGTDYWGQVFWKNSVGPVEERIGFRNHWGYWTSQHIGFYDYLVMAEALGAKALPVLNNGVTCQFAGHKYIAPLETEEDRQRFNDIFVDDALDLIEFCNGDVTTEWGAKRAEMGHPEPFNLEYLSIGNENQGEAFWERFDIMYKAIKEKYPEMIIVTTAGARDAGREFDTNYGIIDNKYPDTIVDEHYYKGDEWFYNSRDRYNPGMKRGAGEKAYDREQPTRVFVGEFANNGTNNIFSTTLAEAAYYTGLERNADMVVMAAYAPLFCKKGFNKWNSNLIWFDNRGLWRTSNYYYMMMFAQNVGNRAFEASELIKNGKDDAKGFTSATVNTETGELYVKIVNADPVVKSTSVNIDSVASYDAELVYLASDDLNVKNQKDQNYYSSYPGIEDFNYDEAVTPQTRQLGMVKGNFTLEVPANSVCVLKLTVK